MMQECPKCGFTQPADRYCANCGLDIENFKPVPDSILKKLAKNTGLHITIVVLVISLLSVFIYFEQKNKLLEHLNPSSTATIPAVKPTLQEATIQAPTPEKEILEAVNPTEKIETPPTNNDEKTPAVKKEIQNKIMVTFAEVSSVVLQQLANEGQIINDSALRRAFINKKIESVEKIKEKDPDFKILPGGKNHNIQVNNPIPFDFSHLNANNEDIGLSFEITPVNSNEAEIEFNLTGLLHLKDESDAPLTNQSINANFSFSRKTTLVLAGYLPHQAISAQDQDFFTDTPLVIFDSLAFLNGVTEFVIFVQAK